MNKINLFFPTVNNNTMDTIISVPTPNPFDATLNLVATLIIDGMPSQYQFRFKSPNSIIFDKQALPLEVSMIDLGIGGLVNIDLILNITLHHAQAHQCHDFTLELYKENQLCDYSTTSLFFI